MSGNAQVRPCPLAGPSCTISPGNSAKISPPAFCEGRIRDSLSQVAWRGWEMAMSEIKQQTIALWILLMLLLMVPWVLE
jgi:hypothetical protein